MLVSASRTQSEIAMICLGRNGDIINSAPIATELYLRHGKPVEWIVSPQYVPLLEAIPHARPVVFDGQPYEVGRALKRFAKRYQKLHVAQAYARDHKMPAPATDSFCTEVWHRIGMRERFGLLPHLERNREREALLLEKLRINSDPLAIVSVSGVSSPFPHRAELFSLLGHIGGVRIVDISDLRCERPQDLLALLDRARVAVLSDSFPLHLAGVSANCKIVALQTDTPSRWFGASPRSNWIASARYAEKEKLPELIDIFRKEAQKPASNPAGIAVRGLMTGAYNPSVIRHQRRTLLAYRYHPRFGWPTLLRMAELSGVEATVDKPLEIVGYDGWSQEDPHLFLHNGRLWSSCVVTKVQQVPDFCCVLFGELNYDGHWRMSSPAMIDYGGNGVAGTQKNWVFFSHNGALFCIYQSHAEQIVLEIGGGKVVNEHKSAAPIWPFGSIRGDTAPLDYRGKLLRFFHSANRYKSGKWQYHLGALVQDSAPPFAITQVSRFPIMSGNNAVFCGSHHHKVNIVFCGGAVRDGDEFLVSVGHNDECAKLHWLPERMLNL